jgi:hypothetical protein
MELAGDTGRHEDAKQRQNGSIVHLPSFSAARLAAARPERRPILKLLPLVEIRDVAHGGG